MKIKTFAKRALLALSLAVGVVAVPSFADPSAIDTAITAAQTAGKASIELTTTGMIQIVAVVVGIGLIIGLLKRI